LAGGALIRQNNLCLVKDAGVLVYLSAQAKTLKERLNGSKNLRPLLAHEPSVTLEEHIERLLSERESQYEEADFKIETDTLTDREVTSMIIEKMELK